MNDDDDSAPRQPIEPCWGNFYHHPDVERVELLDTAVLVRMNSGIELEWSRDRAARGTRTVAPPP